MGMSKPMVFDGYNNYLEVADNAAHDMGTGDFSISAWIRVNDSTTANTIVTKSQSNNGSLPRWFFHVSATTGTLLMNVRNDTNELEQSSTFTVHDGGWHHVVAVIDRGTGVIFYKDGGNTDSNADTDATATVDNNGKLRIGINAGATSYFAGDINELAIWKDALTLAEVQAIFNDGVALDVTSDSGNYASSGDLVGYWRNDGASNWTDRSDSEVNLSTVSGSPDTILLPEGTTSGKDILGFPLTHPNSGWLNLSGAEYVVANLSDGMSSQVNTGIFTFDFWVKHDKDSSGITETYFCLRDIGTSGNRFKLRKTSVAGSNTFINFYVEGGAEFGYSSAHIDLLDEGEWHYIAFVSSGLSSRQIYHAKTGATSLTAVTANTTTYANTNLWDEIHIGKLLEGGGDNVEELDGSIDEFRMYSRALTSAELLKNYKHGKSKHS
jgi:hypothetical protein